MKPPSIALVGLLCVLPVGGSAGECAVSGEPVQWLADYCMMKVQTDDIIAADSCMNEGLIAGQGGDCERKTLLKQKMCEMAVEAGSEKGSVGQCAQNPDLMGNTVRNGGVGD